MWTILLLTYRTCLGRGRRRRVQGYCFVVTFLLGIWIFKIIMMVGGGRGLELQEVLLRWIFSFSIHIQCTACTVIYINFASRYRQQKKSAPFLGDSRIHYIVGTTRSFSPSNPKLVLHRARTSGGDCLALLWWQTIQSNSKLLRIQ